MQSLHQPANEPNRKRRAPAVSRLRCFGVAVLLAAPLLAAPLLAGTASARAASPTGNAPAAHAAVRYPPAFIEWKLSAGSPRQWA